MNGADEVDEVAQGDVSDAPVCYDKLHDDDTDDGDTDDGDMNGHCPYMPVDEAVKADATLE